MLTESLKEEHGSPEVAVVDGGAELDELLVELVGSKGAALGDEHLRAALHPLQALHVTLQIAFLTSCQMHPTKCKSCQTIIFNTL